MKEKWGAAGRVAPLNTLIKSTVALGSHSYRAVFLWSDPQIRFLNGFLLRYKKRGALCHLSQGHLFGLNGRFQAVLISPAIIEASRQHGFVMESTT